MAPERGAFLPDLNSDGDLASVKYALFFENQFPEKMKVSVDSAYVDPFAHGLWGDADDMLAVSQDGLCVVEKQYDTVLLGWNRERWVHDEGNGLRAERVSLRAKKVRPFCDVVALLRFWQDVVEVVFSGAGVNICRLVRAKVFHGTCNVFG